MALRTEGDGARQASDKAADAREGSSLFPLNPVFTATPGTQFGPRAIVSQVSHSLRNGPWLWPPGPAIRLGGPHKFGHTQPPAGTPTTPFQYNRAPSPTSPEALKPLRIATRAAEASGNCSFEIPSPNALPGSATSAAIVPRERTLAVAAYIGPSAVNG